jgi:hypothetical protein
MHGAQPAVQQTDTLMQQTSHTAATEQPLPGDFLPQLQKGAALQHDLHARLLLGIHQNDLLQLVAALPAYTATATCWAPSCC